MKPNIEIMRLYLSYNAETGVLRRIYKNRPDTFDIVPLGDGRMYYEGVRYPITHIIWALHYGEWPKGEIEIKIEPIAWYYELAKTIHQDTKEYAEFAKCLTFEKPNVPEGSIKNLSGLYTANQILQLIERCNAQSKPTSVE